MSLCALGLALPASRDVPGVTSTFANTISPLKTLVRPNPASTVCTTYVPQQDAIAKF
jgi:hypothetical protein